MHPLISVIMLSYNSGMYIKESIDSILNQTYNNLELIIIDGRSSDDTVRIISSYDDQRIQLYHQTDMGPVKALNKGLSVSKGTYITRQDADDISDENRLETEFRYLENNSDVIAVGSSAKVVDMEGNYLFTKNRNDSKFKGLPFVNASVMFRRTVVDQSVFYPELSVATDHAFMHDISAYGKIVNLPHILYTYRIHPNAISRKNRETIRCTNRLLDEYIRTGIINESYVNRLDLLRSSTGKEEKYYLYYTYLAKKYLLDNYQPSLARKNLIKATNIRPDISLYLFIILSYFNRGIIDLIYLIYVKFKKKLLSEQETASDQG